MEVEELLNLLAERGLEDAQKVELLQGALEAVQGQGSAEEPQAEEEKADASKLLGVEL